MISGHKPSSCDAIPSDIAEPCRICGNKAGNKLWPAREMMFGLRDQFHYLECASCGCVQLERIPSDMEKYYPPDYYSYGKHGWAKSFLRHRWSASEFGQVSLLGWLFTTAFFPNRAMRAIRRINPSKSARILDVGCGAGNLLLDLQYLGFKNLTGLDPYIKEDLHYKNNLTVLKRPLDCLKAEFDLIMLHHSFEHMDKPLRVMQSLKNMLHPEGKILIRIPVASSFAWRHYRTNWVNLDAPRHFFLHTTKSIDLLAQQSGLKVHRIVQEGDEGLFFASEAYARNIPMTNPRFPRSSPLQKMKNFRQLRDYKRKAAELNAKGEADQVCFELSNAA